MSSQQTEKYVSLISRFLDHKIEPTEFERVYLDLFKHEAVGMSEAEYSPLERLFEAVDAFCPDDSLRSANDLNENQLRDVARMSLLELPISKFILNGIHQDRDGLLASSEA